MKFQMYLMDSIKQIWNARSRRDEMTILEAQIEYNKLLERFNKANEYFERTDISHEEKEKFLDNFQEVLKGLNYLLSKIEVYTKQEVLEGFK